MHARGLRETVWPESSSCPRHVCGAYCAAVVRALSAFHFSLISMPPPLLFFFFSFLSVSLLCLSLHPSPHRFLSLPQSNYVSSHTPLRIESTAKLSFFRPITRISKSISGQEKVSLPRSVSADSFLLVKESTVRFYWTRSGLVGCYPKLSTLRFANYACLHKAG